MKQTLLVYLCAVIFAVGMRAGPVPTPTLQLIPASGTVSGNAGAAVGWGLTLTYSAPDDWVLLTGSSFTGSTTFGTYRDYLGGEFIVAGPSPETSPVMVPFDMATLTGLGEFDINSTAAPGDIPGDLIVHYSVFSQDPNDPDFNPDTATVVPDATLSVAVDVDVAPEPASLYLITAALLPFGIAEWRRRVRR